MRERRLSELCFCSVVSVEERPEKKGNTGLWRACERSGETRESGRAFLKGKG